MLKTVDLFISISLITGVWLEMLDVPIILTSIFAFLNLLVSDRMLEFLSRFILIGLFFLGVSCTLYEAPPPQLL
jgi:hypothetical protein